MLAEVKVGWVATVATAVSSLLGWTPWRVVVDLDGDVASAQILRNGHSRGSVILTGKDGKVAGSDAPLDPHVFLAAFVVTTLAEAHRGFEGLCGATHWRGVGLQYAASGLAKEDGLALLKQAVQDDPGNWLAQADLQHQLHRESDDPAELNRYAAWLDQAIVQLAEDPDPDAQEGRTPLVLRLLLIRASVRVNRVFAEASGVKAGADADALISDARNAIIELCRAAHKAERALSPRSGLWLEVVRSRAAAMAEHVPTDDLVAALGADVAGDVREWARLNRSPSAHYTWACAAATPDLREPVPADRNAIAARVVPHLRAASVSDDLMHWLPKDPQLAWFCKTDHCDEFRPRRRTDLLALSPFSAHRPALEKCGLDSPDLLASTDPTELALTLGVSRPAAARMVEVATVYGSLSREKALTEVAVEAVGHLLEKGQCDRTSLSALTSAGAQTLANSLAQDTVRFLRSTKEADGAKTFRSWLRGFKPSLAETLRAEFLAR